MPRRSPPRSAPLDDPIPLVAPGSIPSHPMREEVLTELHARGDLGACLTKALEIYGDELHGFLRARAGDGDVAESYAAVCAALVDGLPRFERRSSFRTWMYQVARFTLTHAARARRAKHIPL